MKWVQIVLRLFPTVVALIKIAEELFDDIPESGAQKKELVMAAIKSVLAGVTGIAGDSELLGKIVKAVSYVIDAACLFLFPNDEADAEE